MIDKLNYNNFKIGIFSCYFLFIISIAFTQVSCKVYSFTGASISTDTKTVSVALFENNATLVVPTLSQSLTELLKDRIVSQTSLQITRNSADIEFDGFISDYNVRPISIQGNETASQNRLTISVKVKYSNNKDETKSFDNTFTRYSDFPATRSLADVETELIRIINVQLVDDIFNKAFVNW